MKQFPVLIIAIWLGFAVPVQARLGGGRSMGNRGSRSVQPHSYPSSPSSPFRSSPSPGYPGQNPSMNPYGGTPAPAGGGFMRNMMGGMAGGMLGSMLGRGLFGGGGGSGGYGGGGGGMNLLDILILLGIAFFAYRWFQRRQLSQSSCSGGGYGRDNGGYQPSVIPFPQALQTNEPSSVQGEGQAEDLLRRTDSSFDLGRFKESRLDDFFLMQAAFMNRDLSGLRDKFTPEMWSLLEEDLRAQRAAGKMNHLENITIRENELMEAWQESGKVYATLRLKANLLDYTVDDKTGAVLEGSKTEPSKFEEHWTFVRDQGASGNSWKLSAIEQNQ